MSRHTLAVFLVASSPLCAQAPAADPAALHFLAALGDRVDERALGSERLVFVLAGARRGEVELRFEEALHDGTSGYCADAVVRIAIPERPVERMEARSYLAPDLAGLEARIVETKGPAEAERTKSTSISRSGVDLEVAQVEGASRRAWRVEAPPGLVDSGAEFLLFRLLALAGPDVGVRMTFLERHQDRFFPFQVEVLGPGRVEIQAGTFDAFGFREKKIVYDDATGRERTGDEGKPLVTTITHWLARDGRTLLMEFDGTPARFEARPAGEATSAVDAVLRYFRALADGDGPALGALIDSDRVFAQWKAGPGRGRPPEELAALESEFGAVFVRELLASVAEDAREGYRLLARAEYWTTQPAAGGEVVVRMVDEVAGRDESLARLAFHARPQGDGTWLLVRLSGP